VSQTRLSTSTEITVDTLVLPQTTDTKSQTALTLVTGRTWSRIIRLLELDSAYTVRTDDVVATVRGTAFEAAKIPGKESWIAVYEGKVNAADRVMEKGSGMMRKARGAWRFVSSTTELLPQNKTWIEQNTQDDKQFLKDTQNALQRELTKDTSGAYDVFGRSAERLHMALTDEKEKAALADQYLGRRLALVKELQDQGNGTKAEQELNQIKTEMQAWTSQAAPDKQAELFKQTMIQGSILYHDAQTEPSTLFLKDKIDTIKNDLLAPPIQPVEQSKLDPAGTPSSPTITPSIKEPTQLVPQPIEKIDPSVPPTGFIAPDATAPPIDKAAQEPLASQLIPTELRLYCPNLQLHLKESASVAAIVFYNNGTRRDVTNLVTLTSSDPSVGLVAGNMVQANEHPGQIRVTASYRENGVTVTYGLSFDVQL
jgi:hypothetical protein